MIGLSETHDNRKQDGLGFTDAFSAPTRWMVDMTITIDDTDHN